MIRLLARRITYRERIMQGMARNQEMSEKESYVSEILPRLYLGSSRLAFDKLLLKKFSITHIVSCAAEINPNFPNDFKYLNLPLSVSLREKSFPLFDSGAAFIDEGIKLGSVYVHW